IGGDLVLEDGLTPVTGAGILLLNDTGWPLKAYRTGTDGLWFFDNLSTGTYYVYPEVVNKITYPIKINIITPGSEIE
ncbi:hypothetical protein Q8G46_28375, partial [Klebsiella pneumoniae]|uniref:hypothetical protein n=1 Tax=Klebsiella pneumoniae TaxID=573 RepID=UPI003013C05D